MSLVVGHNCPGCGLDTPSVACEACAADVVWDRENGSHCGACGQSASTFICPECGLSAELDKRQPEHVVRPVLAPAPQLAAEPRRSRALAPLRTALVSAPVRTLALVALAGAQGVLIALLIGGLGDGAQTRRDVAVVSAPAAAPDRIGRGAVQLSPDAKPVPLQPSSAAAAPLPAPRFEPAQPPAATTWAADTGYRPAPPPPPRQDAFWQRALRSGRASTPSGHHIPADAPGIGQ